MAVQTTEEFLNGGATSYAITIEYLQASDIKVRIGGTLQNYVTGTPGNGEYSVSGTTVTLGAAAPAGSGNVHIYRETDVNTAAAVFAAGSSIRAADLNAIHDMGRFAAVEHRNQVITANIKDGQVTTAKIAADNITSALIADDQIDSEHYVADSIDSEHYAPGSVDTAAIGAQQVTTNELATDSVNTTKIIDLNVTTAKIANDAINGTKIADDSINSEHYVDGSIDHVHLANDIIDGDNIQDDVVDSEHIVAGALDNEHYAAGSITSDKLNGATVITSTEQGSATTNDTSFLTSAAADARFFNISTGDTIKDGDTFPDNDTTIATTAAINDRIIDLVDDVGGFVPIANETSFPATNPDINLSGSAKGGTIVSVQAASTALTAQSGTTLTIANGRGTGNAVIITGVSATIPQGFGFLVETTQTDHTYAFHRLVPKATEVTTVAGISGNVTTVANNNANVTTVATNIANVNTTAGDIANVNTTAGSIANVNTVATNIANVNTTAGSIANVNTTAGSIANVNTTATNIASVNNASANINSINNFGDTYQVHSNNPTTDGGGNALAAGDLYFNTSANELKVYNGSAWQSGVTATGNFATVTGNTFTGDNRYNDGVKGLYGTGSDLEIFHDGSHSRIKDTGTGGLILSSNQFQLTNAAVTENLIKGFENGAVELYYDNSKKLETDTSGIGVTGNLTISGNVDGRDLAADGSKLDTYEANGSSYLRSDAADIKTSGDLTFNDNIKATFGTGNDLEIYHDGSGSAILNSAGSGQLTIASDNALNLTSRTGTEYFFRGYTNGAVELYHDNSKKFETTSSGVTVTGQLSTTDTISTVGNLDMSDSTSTGNNRIRLGTGDDLELYHDGSNSFIKDAGTGSLKILANQTQIINAANSENIANFTEDGAVELYYDNSKKLYTNTSGIVVQGDVFLADSNKFIAGNSSDLQIYHDGSNSYIKDQGTGSLLIDSDSQIVFRTDTFTVNNAANSENMLVATADNAVELYYDGSKKFHTYSGGCTVFGNLNLEDNDRLRIGDSSDLQIWHDGTHTRVHNTGGNLDFRAQSYRFNNASGTENCLDIDQNGAVVLYYDHGQKLATTAGGVNITGELNVTTKVAYPDNAKAIYGTHDDLEVYHNGTNSFVSNSTGKLMVQNTNGNIQFEAKNGEDSCKMIPDGAVELYHDNSLKFATTGSGVNVTGTVTATSFVGSGAGLTGISAIPAGTVVAMAMTSMPTGWLVCNGAAVSRSSYADLFSAIGTTYGAGDGSSTFNLPELRGEFIRGLDNGRGIDSGRNNGSFQDHGIPALKGMFYDIHGGSRMGIQGVSGYTNPFVGNSASSWRTLINNVYGNYFYIELDSTQVIPAADHVRPRNVAMTYAIKA